MDLHKLVDCTLGTCVGLWGAWIGEHWMTALGAALLVYRVGQAALEACGVDVAPGWLARRMRRRRNGWR